MPADAVFYESDNGVGCTYTYRDSDLVRRMDPAINAFLAELDKRPWGST